MKVFHVRELIKNNLKRFKENIDYINLIDKKFKIVVDDLGLRGSNRTKNIYLLSIENKSDKSEYFGLTTFNKELREIIEKNIGKLCQFVCLVKPNNYQKKDGTWVNSYSFIVEHIKIIGDEVEFQNINEDEIPF